MGLNIIVKKIVDKEMIEGWHNNLVPYYHTEKQEWFSSLRYAGDRDFIKENKFQSYDNSDAEGKGYIRPKDFNKCREWVNEHIYEGIRPRLLKALDELEKDSSLVFSLSW